MLCAHLLAQFGGLLLELDGICVAVWPWLPQVQIRRGCVCSRVCQFLFCHGHQFLERIQPLTAADQEPLGSLVQDCLVDDSVVASCGKLPDRDSAVWARRDGRQLPGELTEAVVNTELVGGVDVAHPDKAVQSLAGEKVATPKHRDWSFGHVDFAVALELHEVHAGVLLLTAKLAQVLWAFLATEARALVTALQEFCTAVVAGQPVAWSCAWQGAGTPVFARPGAFFDARGTRLLTLLLALRVRAPNLDRR